MMNIASIYDKPLPAGEKVLTTRLWPRGIKKTAVSLWLKELGPDYKLLRRYKDGKIEWPEFRKEYLAGLKRPKARKDLKTLKSLAAKKAVTILCVCKDESRCHRSLLAARLSRSSK